MYLPTAKLTKFPSTRLALLVLLLHTGLFVIPALLKFFEETFIRKFPLRDLKSLLDIIVINADFQRFPFAK